MEHLSWISAGTLDVDCFRSLPPLLTVPGSSAQTAALRRTVGKWSTESLRNVWCENGAQSHCRIRINVSRAPVNRAVLPGQWAVHPTTPAAGQVPPSATNLFAEAAEATPLIDGWPAGLRTRHGQ